MSKTHELKCWPAELEHILAGRKTHDVRRNDRGYQVGDRLHLREWDPATEEYGERRVVVTITHITRLEDWISDEVLSPISGWVVLGIM